MISHLPPPAGALGSPARPPADLAAGEATLHLRASPAAFLRVATGRRSPAAGLPHGDLIANGDPDILANFLEHLNVVP